MVIRKCEEIVSKGGIFQLWIGDGEEQWISLIEDGRYINANLVEFDVDELVLIGRHIQAAIEIVEAKQKNEHVQNNSST